MYILAIILRYYSLLKYKSYDLYKYYLLISNKPIY